MAPGTGQPRNRSTEINLPKLKGAELRRYMASWAMLGVKQGPILKVNRTPITSFQSAHRFLSNFYPHWVTFEGVRYPTAEHAYQASKSLHDDKRQWILEADTPSEAKRRGRQIPLRPRWEAIKTSMMIRVLEQKFADPRLQAKLIRTWPADLIEGNWWGDTYWGVDNRTGRGQNMLGKLLMEVREMALKGTIGAYTRKAARAYKYKREWDDKRLEKVPPVKKLPKLPPISGKEWDPVERRREFNKVQKETSANVHQEKRARQRRHTTGTAD